jgi:hypothetical protein
VGTTTFVDEHTGRVQRTVWDRETDNSHRISDSYYSDDRAGTSPPASVSRPPVDVALSKPGSTSPLRCEYAMLTLPLIMSML